jgi:eukaryotic-like serine/threonine-protein kinase
VAEEVIGGYRLLNLMMTGQSSQVWEVVEVASPRHFTMKLLLPEKAREAEHRRLLMHEAAVGKKLAHPNVIRIVHVHSDSKNPYFVMEFFPAGSLKFRMNQALRIAKQGAFIKEHAMSIFRQAATALAYMNASGWVHRDVKPDNILVNSAGEVRIIDFALAVRIQKPSFFSNLFRRKGLTSGTRSYMSPEQIRNEPLDGRADIYSFAASMYEVTTNRPPFRAGSNQELLTKHVAEKPASPQVHNPDLTDEFCDLVLMMLAKKRAQRPPDFHQVLMKLRTIKIYKSDPGPKPEEGPS